MYGKSPKAPHLLKAPHPKAPPNHNNYDRLFSLLMDGLHKNHILYLQPYINCHKTKLGFSTANQQ